MNMTGKINQLNHWLKLARAPHMTFARRPCPADRRGDGQSHSRCRRRFWLQ